MAGTRRTGLSCGTSGTEAKIQSRVLAYIARGQRPFFHHRNMPLTCGNIKLRDSNPDFLAVCKRSKIILSIEI
jgi:hypothetical protein